eukprot:365253-Chlamydomonas_euryale.AAC.15
MQHWSCRAAAKAFLNQAPRKPPSEETVHVIQLYAHQAGTCQMHVCYCMRLRFKAICKFCIKGN